MQYTLRDYLQEMLLVVSMMIFVFCIKPIFVHRFIGFLAPSTGAGA